MPFRFHIDQEADLVLTIAEGDVTAEDLIAHARALARTPDRPLHELVDFSDRVDVTIPTEVVRNMAEFLSQEDGNPPGSRLAMVAKTDAIFGMLRLFEAHREHSNVALRVFRNRDEAFDWLMSDRE